MHERTAELSAANEALQQSRDQLQSLTRRLVQAQENERAAIARELHDGAGQVLDRHELGLEHAGSEMTGDPPEIAARDPKGPRRGAMGSRPNYTPWPPTCTRSPWPAWAWWRPCASTSATFRKRRVRSFVSTPRSSNDSPLPAEVELAVYRVIQEAVNNALRHAQARSIDVVMQMQLGQPVGHDRR